ncbi:MAG: hypothetical protein AAB036_07200 [Elusimicrobiota bacterium]
MKNLLWIAVAVMTCLPLLSDARTGDGFTDEAAELMRGLNLKSTELRDRAGGTRTHALTVKEFKLNSNQPAKTYRNSDNVGSAKIDGLIDDGNACLGNINSFFSRQAPMKKLKGIDIEYSYGVRYGTSEGKKFSYRVLVIAMGLTFDTGRFPAESGLLEFYDSDPGHSEGGAAAQKFLQFNCAATLQELFGSANAAYEKSIPLDKRSREAFSGYEKF